MDTCSAGQCGGGGEQQAQCMRCKKKVTVKNGKETITDKGTRIMKGECAVCGGNVAVILPKKKK